MDKDYRGRGLGAEALRQAAAYAFDELEMSLLVLTVFPNNTSAINCTRRSASRGSTCSRIPGNCLMGR